MYVKLNFFKITVFIKLLKFEIFIKILFLYTKNWNLSSLFLYKSTSYV